jgi:hypothetical protein
MKSKKPLGVKKVGKNGKVYFSYDRSKTAPPEYDSRYVAHSYETQILKDKKAWQESGKNLPDDAFADNVDTDDNFGKYYHKQTIFPSSKE